VQLHREILARAERAADAGQHEPHAVRRQPQAGRDLVAVEVQPLRRDVQLDAPVAVGNCQPGLRTQERLVLDADLVTAADDHLAGGARVTAHDRDRPQQVALRVQRGRAGGQRGLHRDDRVQRLVAHVDQGRGAPGGRRVIGGDDRDRLAVVADAVDGEHGLIGPDDADAAVARNVVGGQHRVHAVQCERGARVDAQDPRRGVRRAGGRAVQHPVDPQVRGVQEPPVDLRGPVGARQPRADVAVAGDLLGALIQQRRLALRARAGVRDGARVLRAPVVAPLRAHASTRSRIRVLSRRRSAASVSGSAVRSSPPSTTTRPPTSSVSTARVGPKTSAAIGSSMPA
jgi:hypothetical protein